MNMLITGVPGWLGNRFLEVLVKGFNGEGTPQNNRIRCLVQKGVNTSEIDNLLKIKNIEKIIGDVSNIDTLKDVAKDIDLVFHIAGIIHPKRLRKVRKICSKYPPK